MIGIIGGTGPEGTGLALRFAGVGEKVIIGSRSEQRGRAAAGKVRGQLQGADVKGAENAVAAAKGDLVIVAVPYEGQRETLTALQAEIGDKIVVVTVVPLKVVEGRFVAVPPEEGSAAQEAQALLPRARVVAAFQNLSAQSLVDLEEPVDADVIICGDDAGARETVMGLAEEIDGVRALDGGPLANARYVEEMTALLLNINKRYKAHASIRVTGI